jgi:hypothetical protein
MKLILEIVQLNADFSDYAVKWASCWSVMKILSRALVTLEGVWIEE